MRDFHDYFYIGNKQTSILGTILSTPLVCALVELNCNRYRNSLGIEHVSVRISNFGAPGSETRWFWSCVWPTELSLEKDATLCKLLWVADDDDDNDAAAAAAAAAVVDDDDDDDDWPVICINVEVGMTSRCGSPPGVEDGINTVVVDAAMGEYGHLYAMKWRNKDKC